MPRGLPEAVPAVARHAGRQHRRTRFARVQPRPRRAPRQRGAERAQRGRLLVLAAQRDQLPAKSARSAVSTTSRAGRRTVASRSSTPRSDPDGALEVQCSGSGGRDGRRCCVAPSAHAQAQRLSLAERVDRLEQQQSNAQSSGGAVDLVNQISALQSQVQSLQGQVEELKHALDETKQRNKDQYVDLDSRLGRLEGGNAAPPPAAAGGRPAARNDNPPDVDLGAPAGAPKDAAAARQPLRSARRRQRSFRSGPRRGCSGRRGERAGSRRFRRSFRRERHLQRGVCRVEGRPLRRSARRSRASSTSTRAAT